MLLPGTYQGGHLCNYRWKREKLNHYSLSYSQIPILEHVYSMLLESISKQINDACQKIEVEGKGQEADKYRLEKGKK